MRSGSSDSGAALPWHVVREDRHGNRYRVGSYATRGEAQQVADRLTAGSAARAGAARGAAGASRGSGPSAPAPSGTSALAPSPASGAAGDRADSYLVESVTQRSGDRA